MSKHLDFEHDLIVRGCSGHSLALARRFYRRSAGIFQTPSARYPSMPADQQFHARRPTSDSPVASDELTPIVQTPSAQFASHTPADDASAPRPSVSGRFRQAGIKGASATRLTLRRQFYRQRKPIGPTPSDQLLLSAVEREILTYPDGGAVYSTLCFDRPTNCKISWSKLEDYVQRNRR